MRDITTAVIDEDLEQFLLEASGVDSLIAVDYATGEGDYGARQESWQSRPGSEA